MIVKIYSMKRWWIFLNQSQGYFKWLFNLTSLHSFDEFVTLFRHDKIRFFFFFFFFFLIFVCKGNQKKGQSPATATGVFLGLRRLFCALNWTHSSKSIGDTIQMQIRRQM